VAAAGAIVATRRRTIVDVVAFERASVAANAPAMDHVMAREIATIPVGTALITLGPVGALAPFPGHAAAGPGLTSDEQRQRGHGRDDGDYGKDEETDPHGGPHPSADLISCHAIAWSMKTFNTRFTPSRGTHAPFSVWRDVTGGKRFFAPSDVRAIHRALVGNCHATAFWLLLQNWFELLLPRSTSTTPPLHMLISR